MWMQADFLRLEDGVLIVRDGDAEHRMSLSPRTLVIRGVGRTLVSDGDTSRLRSGDSLVIQAQSLADESFEAELIIANRYVGEPGIVVDRGVDYLDLRLKRERASEEFEPVSTRVWLVPNAKAEWSYPYGQRLPADFQDYALGSVVAIDGFFADDGARVVTSLWSYLPAP